MIKFFRKTRQRLLYESKIGKYLTYAIGEIILITVGILIAVQINSFKTYQNNRIIEKQVLLKLRSDLQKDTADLNNLLRNKNDQMADCYFVLDIFSNPSQTISNTAKFRKNIIHPFYFYVDNPNKSIFELAKSSGDLFKISNDTLIEIITIYFSDNNMNQFLATSKKFSTDYMSEVFLRNYKTNFQDSLDFQNFKNDFFTDFKMQNYYFTLLTHLDIGINLISEKIENAVKIMEQIDNQILQIEK